MTIVSQLLLTPLIIIIRAGILVLGTCTRSTRVLNFWYSSFTRTREFQSNSTFPRTRAQVLRYSNEYWHECLYSMVHLRCKGENHHACEINSLTLFCNDLNIWYKRCNSNFHSFIQFYHHRQLTELLLWCLWLFVQVHSPIQLLANIWISLLQTLKKDIISTHFMILRNFCLLVFELVTSSNVNHDSQCVAICKLKCHCTKLHRRVNTLRPRQNGRHFADDIFKCIFWNKNVWIPIEISLKFVHKDAINNIPALVQIMARRRPGDKPISEPMIVYRRIYASFNLNELNRYIDKDNSHGQ